MLRVRSESRSLASRQSGRMLEKYLLVLDLAGHDGAGNSGGLEGLNQPRKFAEREPVDLDSGIGGSAGVHLRIGLFLERRDDDLFAVGAGGFEQQERKAAVAGDQTEFLRSDTD